MTVLVTGGAGYIGSHAAIELLNCGYDIVMLDNFSNSKKEVINRIKEISGKDFTFYEVDLLDYDRINEIFKQHPIESVMHFAGLKAVGESVNIPLTYYHNNITGTLILLRVMKKHNVKKLVFSSSATVYGNPKQVPISETAPLSATNPYGRTKLMIEEILRDLYISDNTWRIAILRYFNPIGAHKSGRIGENPNGVPNNIMPFISQVAVGKREKLYVFGNDYNTHDGTGIRDYIHVVDLVKGHIKALEYIKHHTGVEAFNLGTGKGYSVLDLVKKFSEVSKVRIPYEFTSRRPGDVAICYANPEKAEKILNWKAQYNLHEMCEDTWRWQSQNPNGFD